MSGPEKIGWYDRILELLSPTDREAVGRMRAFFLQRPTPQNWYYPLAGADNVPIFIAPRLTTHWLVDLGYDRKAREQARKYKYTERVLADNFVRPFERLGAKVTLEFPWETALRNRRQTMIIDSDTRIELVGADIDYEEIVPRPYDVIYNNDYLGMQILGEFIELKTRGLYVFAAAMDFDNTLRDHSSGLSLADFGLTKQATFVVENFSLPGIDRIESVPAGTEVFFQIYEKPRDFTEEEKDILKKIASWWTV